MIVDRRIGNINALRRRAPTRAPVPRDIRGHTRTLAAPGADATAILSPPRDIANWRHRALFFRDPEGNVIELYAEI